MNGKLKQKTTRSTPSFYRIALRGALEEESQDCFKGMLIAIETGRKPKACTTILCKVADQSELIGNINWLHDRNLVIENVSLVPEE